VEKNYEIILIDNFASNFLLEGDKIEIVHFIGGG
jgi:thiamine biosynthesis protein ThiS